jgi:hypothetical protein
MLGQQHDSIAALQQRARRIQGVALDQPQRHRTAASSKEFIELPAQRRTRPRRDPRIASKRAGARGALPRERMAGTNHDGQRVVE